LAVHPKDIATLRDVEIIVAAAVVAIVFLWVTLYTAGGVEPPSLRKVVPVMVG